MVDQMQTTIYCTLALLALINPVSKIFVLTTLDERPEVKNLRKIALQSTLIAIGILITFALGGNILLRYIFQVKIYSLQIAGGFILLYRGFQALNKGVFFELAEKMKLMDASIVPLASPMIAGPATITAALSFPARYGMAITIGSIVLATCVNLLVMLSAHRVSDFLGRHNLIGALIRITGLIVAAIGIQMSLDGIAVYIQNTYS